MPPHFDEKLYDDINSIGRLSFHVGLNQKHWPGASVVIGELMTRMSKKTREIAVA